MKNVVIAGKQGVFFSKEEYQNLCNKILANNQLIKELKKEVGLEEKNYQYTG